MKAIRFHQTGGPEVLRFEDVPTAVSPAPARCASGTPPWRSTSATFWCAAASTAVKRCRRVSAPKAPA